MTNYPVRIYNEIYSSEGRLIKNLFAKKSNKKILRNGENCGNGNIFSNRMMTAGISRKVFNSAGKKKMAKT